SARRGRSCALRGEGLRPEPRRHGDRPEEARRAGAGARLILGRETGVRPHPEPLTVPNGQICTIADARAYSSLGRLVTRDLLSVTAPLPQSPAQPDRDEDKAERDHRAPIAAGDKRIEHVAGSDERLPGEPDDREVPDAPTELSHLAERRPRTRMTASAGS